jgi:hypothetical protein
MGDISNWTSPIIGDPTKRRKKTKTKEGKPFPRPRRPRKDWEKGLGVKNEKL